MPNQCFSPVFHTVCYACIAPTAPDSTSDPAMTDLIDTQANVVMGTTEKMVDIWLRLSPEKQAALLKRFGTKENALAALVTTQLLAPAKD